MALRGRKLNQKNETEKSIQISAEMQGSLIFKDPVNLMINGSFSGSLETCGTLTIGNTAKVNANIVGDNIIIAGRVTGDINATTMLVLMPTAVLSGNISTPKLNIVEGAIFQGNCQMETGLLSITDVAKYLEINLKEIENLANSGKIPSTRSGNTWLFDRNKIDDWAASGKVS